jgi:hypothetical protein
MEEIIGQTSLKKALDKLKQQMIWRAYDIILSWPDPELAVYSSFFLQE